MDRFLAVNKNYIGIGLKSIDILIISQIEEYERNKCQCFLTNEQFSEMFGESVSTVKRTLDKLDDLGIIKRDTSTVTGNGRANKQRVIKLNKRSKWKVHNEPTIVECKVQNEPTKEMLGSKSDNGRFKSEEWKVHNEPIKDNKKEKEKENIAAAAAQEKWTPKDDTSKEIFGSDIHSDIRVIEIIKEEYKTKQINEICNDAWVTMCNVNQNKIAEFITEVLIG